MRKLLTIIIIAILLPIGVLAVTIKGSSGARTIRDFTYTDFDFGIASSSRINIISGTVTSTSSRKDLILSNLTGAITDTEGNVSVSAITTSSIFPTITAANPTVATVNSSGVVTWVSNGIAKINVSAPNSAGANTLTKQISLPVSRAGGVVTSSLYGYASGSLGKDASDEIDSRIAGKTAGTTTTELFSTQNHTTATYVWNTSNFLNGVDMTMISPYNGCGGVQQAGTLVSPRTIITAHHFAIGVGCAIRFVKQDGTVVTRTVSALGQVGSTDIEVEVLDSDVPAGIGFADVLPSTYATSLPSITSTTTIPVIGLFGGGNDGVTSHPNKTATVREITHLGGTNLFQESASTTRASFYIANVISGDSGNPSFVLINGHLVLLNCWFSAQTGPTISDNITAINTLMHSLGDSGHSLTTVDVSGFNTY